jgi:hypothetical protein
MTSQSATTDSTDLPRSIAAHLDVLEHAQRHEVIERQLRAARDRCTALERQREELADASVAVLMRLGTIPESALSERAAHLDREVADVKMQVANLELVMAASEEEGRAIRDRARTEIRSGADERMRDLIRELCRFADGIESVVVKMSALRDRSTRTPKVPYAFDNLIQKLRAEARAFGIQER